MVEAKAENTNIYAPEFDESDKITEDRFTNPGPWVSAGTIEASEYDTVNRELLYKDIERMRKSDPVASTTLEILKLPIEQADWKIESAGQDEMSIAAQKYIEWCFNQFNFQYFQRHALLSLDYGASFFEKIFSRGIEYIDHNGKRQITNIISRLSPFQIFTIEKFLYDKQFDLEAIEQWANDNEGMFDRKQISASKLFWIVNREEYKDVRGNSVLRPALQTFLAKIATVKGAARAISRGGGIPDIIIDRQDAKLEASARAVGKNFGNSDLAYVMHTKDIEVKMLQVGSINKAEGFLDFLNRELFFNTLTEFLSAGIGSNGSRAATKEHKSPYELAANAILQSMQREINEKLIPKMFEISYLALIDEKYYPEFKYVSINTSDVNDAVKNVSQLYTIGVLQKRPEDEQFFRSMFNLPDEKLGEPTESLKPEKTSLFKDEPKCEHKHEHKELKQLEGRIYLDASMKNEYNEMLLKNDPESHFAEIQEEANNIILDVQEKMLTDIGEQLEKDPDAEIDVRYTRELAAKLQKLYEKSLEKGSSDFRSEIKALGGKTELMASFELVSQKVTDKIGSNLKITVTKFAQTLTANISKARNNLKTIAAQKYGSWTLFALSFADDNKIIKREMITEVQSGYTDGRAEEIDKLQDEDTFVYNAVLDASLCDNCAPYDGLVLTKKELDGELSLQPGSPVNLFCLGRDRCRCQLQPFSVPSLGIG